VRASVVSKVVMRRTALVFLLLLPLLALPAGAQALEQNCELALTRFDPDTVNTLFPDDSAQYWSSRYTAVPGTRIRISGEYPHTRYMSWNIYDPALRPFDHFADVQLVPDAGSTNPFLPGALRYAYPRHYTMFIEFTPKPAAPAPNTIYVDPTANPRGLFTYRTYIPDRGFKSDGGVGLPHVEWEGVPAGGPDCSHTEKPTTSTVTDTYPTIDGPPTGPPYPGRANPVWRKFVNLCVSGDDLLFDNEPGDNLDSGGESPCGNFGSGGFLSNMDNAYVYSFISRGFGPVLVFRGKAPTFPDTRRGAKRMPSGKQLRYWSFCQNDPYSQRYIDCLADDQVKVDKDGTFTIVVSRPADRPSCAKNWLAWGPQTQGVLIYRHMLPDAGFSGAIQNAQYGSEQASMGGYYPSPRYLTSASEFGCR
jgi:hypothetical protein